MAEASVPLSDDLKRELQEAASGGIEKLKEHIEKKSNEWKKIPLNIGITGESGVGKSSFINAICGFTGDDEDGADVQVVEATKDVKPYVHPKNESLILWDLPGIGTPNFPRTTYLKKVEFERFDFFLILSASRFREDDLWLAGEICKLKKKFHFIRTQMDLEMNKDKKGHPKTHTKNNVMEKIRKNCLTNFEKMGLTEGSVFLIDNYAPHDFDFNILATTLIDEAPEHKKEAMTLSMSVLTEGVLKRKYETLETRIYEISIVSALAGAIPVPLYGAAVDGTILLNAVTFYKKQFGLDDKTMQENARLLNTEVRILQEKLGLRSMGLAQTGKTLVQGFSSLVADEAIESSLPIAIPVVGSIISAGISYGVSVWCLKYLLRMCFDDARKINDELMKHALH